MSTLQRAIEIATEAHKGQKNKDISQEPNLVINGGHRTTPIEGNKGFMSFKNEYVFQNNEYFYIVSYEMVIYNGMYGCSSPQVIF